MSSNSNNNLQAITAEISNLCKKERFFVPEASRLFFLSALPEVYDRRIIFVPSVGSLIEDIYYEAKTFASVPVFEFPDFEILPHEKAKIVSASQSKRLELLANLKEKSGKSISIIHPYAFLRKFPPLSKYQPVKLRLKKGEEFSFDRLVEYLLKMGYERSDMCESEGTFSVRGGIVDIYPAGSENPVRVVFFGDEIEEIREFDVSTQTSISQVEEVEIGWYTDTPLEFNDGIDNNQQEQVNDFLKNGFSLAGFWPLLFPKLDSLFDYLKDKKYLFVFENLEKLELELLKQEEQLKEAINSGFAPLKSYGDYFVDADEVLSFFYGIDHIEIGYLRGSTGEVFIEEVEKRALRDKILFYDYLKKSKKVIVVRGFDLNPSRVENAVRKTLEKIGTPYEIISGYLRNGFFLKNQELLFLPAFYFTGGQIMLKSRKAVRIKGEEFLDLKPGDYVVHPKYGIGIYDGIEKQVREGIPTEYLVINYADGTIKIPLEQADLITKYYGDEEKVQVDSLSSNEWKKARQKAQKSARKLAFDLLKVYAKRSLVKRKPYDISNPWIYEFESLFPYEETLDQAAAINDVYLDMASEQPMERLIIGDVGYGKTEVAMRAAFVAVVNGRQVIVMAPTTVLSEQHYENFKERFQHFPITIGYVSRFQTKSQRQKTIEDFNLGKVDILIGTHAVLSKEISLENVSLVIIDEEHRFGVNQKEIFKARKPEIDVLLLSATPIPRTLQLALSGFRAISFIETPPPGRLPVITHVGEYDELMVLAALRREIERGGQALYVHNNISKLPAITKYLEAKLPGARIAYAHGRMPERKLEKTMVDFWEGKFDVLVCTTIIESGLDMPNVNTLVVDGAEQLGLAQAYQLRGRVGRSYRQAFAYFLVRKRILTEKEEKRLKALLELSGWGSGYRLALRDLEIRGAGNLLGPEQHGHMIRVGIGYFLEMLKHEIEALKAGIRERKEKELSIDIPVDIHIPDDYINSLRIKYEIYRRAAQLESYEELEKLREELVDRFGKPPEEVYNLLYYGLVRNLAKKAGVSFIKYADGVLTFRGEIPAAVLLEEISSLKGGRGILNQVSKEVPRKEILIFLYRVFADIISKIKFEGSY